MNKQLHHFLTHGQLSTSLAGFMSDAGTVPLAEFFREFCQFSGTPFTTENQTELAKLLNERRMLTGDAVSVCRSRG